MGKAGRLWIGVFLIFFTSCQETEDSLDKQVFDQVDQMPEFPGGPDSLAKYLQQRIRYPKQAIEDSISGTVLVEFIVNQTGEIDSARIKESLCATCDSVALVAVNKMPRWKAGELDGLPVNVRLILPIEFSLDSE